MGFFVEWTIHRVSRSRKINYTIQFENYEKCIISQDLPDLTICVTVLKTYFGLYNPPSDYQWHCASEVLFQVASIS